GPVCPYNAVIIYSYWRAASLSGSLRPHQESALTVGRDSNSLDCWPIGARGDRNAGGLREKSLREEGDEMMRRIFAALAVSFALASAAAATTPEEQGTQIFAERERRNAGWQDYQVDLTMILRNALGEESTRALEIRQLEVPDDGDKLLVV